jgi:uncharacterized repeat protein (TIGR01451 family)
LSLNLYKKTPGSATPHLRLSRLTCISKLRMIAAERSRVMILRTRQTRIPLGRASSLLVALAAIWLAAMPAAAQTAADSSAFGESVSLTVLPVLGSGLQVGSGPQPQVSGSAPAAYSKSGSLLSANVSAALTGSILQTGVLDVSAASQVPGAVRTQGGAATHDVALDLGHLLPLLTLDADLIQSAAIVDGTCGSSLVATGSADLINAVAGGGLGLGLTIASHPGPNTVLLDAAGVKIVLNEQFITGNGATSRGITVNAVHVYLQNALLSGLGVMSGEIVISQSHAGVQCGAAPPAAADLGVTGSDSPDPVATGGTLQYGFTVSNQGPNAASGTVLTVTLPAGLSGVSATPSQGSCSAGPPVSCNLGMIGAGQSAVVTVTATVTAGQGTLTSTASVASGVADPGPGNNSVILSTQVAAGDPSDEPADLSLTKSASAASVVSGGTLVYTLTATNHGPGDASGVMVTDALPAGVTLKSAAPSQGSCSAGPPLSCNLGSLAANQSSQVTITVTVTMSSGTLANTAVVTSAIPDPNGPNNTGKVSTPVTAAPGGKDRAACRIDAAPAATLLIPYFAVDLDHPQGVTTVFSVTNAFAQPQLAHVVLWTDWAVPTLTFDIYLTGYDVETVDLRDVLGRGLIPSTGVAVSPVGDLSESNVAFAGCGSGKTKAMPLWMRKHLRAEHTGLRSASTGLCAGSPQANASVAVGYITIDTVRACSSASPGDPGYFVNGGGGIATNQNALLGEYFIVDPSQNQIDGDLAVHLQADAEAFSPDRYTFYSRYSGGADNRQPLGQAYAVPYTDTAPFPDGTRIVVWRDTKSPEKAARSCGTHPSWSPLGQSGVLAFDRQENDALLPAAARSFPLATQLAVAGGPALPLVFHSGWLLLDLGHDATSLFGRDAQAWVTVQRKSVGHFTLSTRSFRLDDLCGVP